jgi:large subunit ribosomal protein L9
VKVVFLEEVEGSGRTGEVRNVANGYARNYLLPRKLAIPATDHNIRIAQARAETEAKRQAVLDADATVLAEKVAGVTITIEVKVGEQGRLYGSVTARDISEALEKPLGLLLEHRQVELQEPIRQVGLFEVPLKLSRNVRASVQVGVLGEGQTLEELLAPPPAEEEEPAEEQAAEAAEEEVSEEAEVEQAGAEQEGEPAEEAAEEQAEEVAEEEAPEEAEVEQAGAEQEEEQPAEAAEEQPAEASEEQPSQEAEAKQEKKGRKRRSKGEGEQS